VILVDTNILSTFARVEELELLFLLFPGSPLGVTPAVLGEVDQALAQGCDWLRQVPALRAGGRLVLAEPVAGERLVLPALPSPLGAGECEAIAVCQARSCAFLTNDKRARNFCRELGIPVYDLVGLLRALWKWKVRSRDCVRQLCARMEAAERIGLNRDAVFRT
jgi:predicted nucleic acid-binding protein